MVFLNILFKTRLFEVRCTKLKKFLIIMKNYAKKRDKKIFHDEKNTPPPHIHPGFYCFYQQISVRRFQIRPQIEN